MPSPRHKTSRQTLTARERELTALRYRKLGMTYLAISDRMGITRSAAYKCVKRAMDKLAAETQEEAHEVRDLELQRLDELTLTFLSRALKGDGGAADRILRIMERRAKLLGLDAPQKRELSNPQDRPIEVAHKIDYSSMSTDQLEKLNDILSAAAVDD